MLQKGLMLSPEQGYEMFSTDYQGNEAQKGSQLSPENVIKRETVFTKIDIDQQ